VVSASSPCEETSSNITINGTTGDTLFYTLDGGAYQTATFVAGTLNLATGIITAPHTYFIHDVHHTGCIITIDSNIVMAPLPVTWNGGTSNNWATAANWNCGAVPLATQGVLIPAGTTYEPIIGIGDSGLARYLTIMPGSNLTVSNTGRLSVKNKLLNNGNVKGSGTVTLNGSSSQHIAGYGKVANLELNNAAGATMDTASKLTITNSLKLTAGTFTTNDSVVLYSDSSTTARVKPITSGSISGNVYVQQFIQGGRRAYRFWSHPFSSYTSLAQAGLAIDVTGAGGAANGFTSTASNAPSAYRYNPLVGNDSLGYDPGWRPFTSALPTADSNRIHQYQGIRLYIRGVKGSGLGYAPYVPAAVTITQWGPLNQGNQRVVLQKGSLNHQGINMLGNPYAAPVDLGTVLYRAKASGNITGSGFWVWNPNLGAAGQYQTIAIGTSTPVPYNLQANTAFQVSAAHNGDTINFTENDKADSVSAYLFRQAQNGITLGVYDANYHPWDYTYIQFDSKAADRFDTSLDAVKLSAADFGFSSISADGQNLSIDARPFSNNYTIPLAVTSGYMQDMIIRADDMTLPDSAIVYLHDKLLGQYIRMQKATEYRFSITKDTATQGRNRFELAMKKASDTFAVSLAKVNMWLAPNPATDDITISYVMPEQSATKLRVLDMAGICVLERNLGIDKTGTVKVPVQKLAAGIYLVELTSGNNTVIKRFVKE
jgi:hypothetical protein